MRREDWPEILSEQLAAGRQRPFEWGRHDCCLFAADVVAAMTGTDYAAEFRGRYRSAGGAKRALTRYGAGSLETTLTAKLGAPVAPRLARRGDVLLLDTEDGPALGICAGTHGFFAAPEGLARMPVAACRGAWRVD